jgi:hypothetical protein
LTSAAASDWNGVVSNEPVTPKATANAEARAVEAAKIRRRWITLGEVLTVIAVVISGLTLWNSWSERSASEASRRDETQQATSRAATLLLTATPSGHELVLKPSSDEQSVQSQTVLFPAALGVSAAETTGEPRIEGGWFEDALKEVRGKAGLPDDSRGDERLPVAITTHFLIGGEAHEDTAIYDIGYTISGRWLSGHSITLRGISLVSRVRRGQAQALLDARWRKRFPKK